MAKEDVVDAAAQAQAGIGAVTLEQVSQMIAAAMTGAVTMEQVTQAIESAKASLREEMNQATSNLFTREEFKAAIDAFYSDFERTVGVAVQAEVSRRSDQIPPVVKAELAVQPKGPIDPKYLAGLKYRTSEARKGGPGDDDSTIHVPVERDLTPADVLDWVVVNDQVNFITADGKSVTVPK